MRFPAIASAMRSFPAKSALIDGEAAFVLPSGITDFKSLQEHIDTPHPAIRYFVFDLLSLDGTDWRKKPLVDRRAKLCQADGGERRVELSRLCGLRRGCGARVLRASLRARARRHHVEACRLALSLGTRQGLAQDQMPQGRGVRDRRLQPLRGEGQAVLIATARHVRGGQADLCGQGRHRVRQRRFRQAIAEVRAARARGLAFRRGAVDRAQGRGLARARARR